MTGFPPDHEGAKVRASPNFGTRRGGAVPAIILLHYTGMESGPAAEDWLCNPQAEVSSHYLVHEDGRVVQFVREADRAWHAGQSCWQGNSDINSASIGIEIVNPGHELGYPDFPTQQIAALIDLCRGIIRRHRILPQNVLAHSDVAPGRKIDPGEKFPWHLLHEAGIGHLAVAAPVTEAGDVLGPGSEGPPARALQSMLSQYGYCLDITGRYDERTGKAVDAFQRHFRPARVDGTADRSTIVTLQRLIDTLPGHEV